MGPTPPAKAPHDLNLFFALSLFLLSACVVALQVALTRILTYVSYHHFSYLVISIALTGFGVSGTVLTFAYKRIKRDFPKWLFIFSFLFTISIPACLSLSNSIPIDIQYLLYSKGQMALLLFYTVLLFLPFFFAALAIESFLIFFKARRHDVYGINLFGTGAGGLMAILLMFWLPLDRLAGAIGGIAYLSQLLLFIPLKNTAKEPGLRACPLLLIGLVVPVWFALFPPSLHVDAYKAASYFKRLEAQGDARKILSVSGPRGQIDIYDSERIHQTMFAGLNLKALPPAQLAILMNGGYGGTVFKIDSADKASVMDFTPQSIPYRLLEKPKVLLLGEAGGANVWLAKRFGAASVTVVNENPQLNGIMHRELAHLNGTIYTQPGVRTVTMAPHLFLETDRDTYDLIQIVSAEGMSAGVSELSSLHEGYLLTTETVARAYEILTPKGMIAITRGIQYPPRDNIKLFALFASALKHQPVADAGKHLFQARNYLAVTTLISKEAAASGFIARYKGVCKALLMDTEYYDGIHCRDSNKVNIAKGREGGTSSTYCLAAREMVAGEDAGIVKNWLYNVSPPSNDRPYFYSYVKWARLGELIKAFGPHWYRQIETGYIVLVAMFFLISLLALVFILLPLFFLKADLKKEKSKPAVFLYFSSIGLAFLFIEMVFTQKFVQLMGDPLYSVSTVIMALLVFAGLGSILQSKVNLSPVTKIRISAGFIFLNLALYLMHLDAFLPLAYPLGTASRFLICIALIAPVSFFMGWMFPLGLQLLETHSALLIPWALGINGFSSVCATVLAMMLSISFGFRKVLILALGLYLLAALVSRHFYVRMDTD
ncbi:hypothetical protein DSLASN_19850 [Desulfoluna limicola]|uniref:Spermidine synthase n=1 Tax=Desulfoluna limicola TaxID=2810562 RepID=A0ABM7PH03_9BACT|nr:hypothetical protein [Desulfoluna limicola]BCS96353.1 hypothetical protein DSLASN_19850 [Desulfoluna limicola]